MAWDLFGRNWLTGICCVWPFSRETIPNGWQECDGTNGTPDWRGYYLRHAAEGVPPGDTYGTETHTNTIGGKTGFADANHWHTVEGYTAVPESGGDDVTDVGGGIAEYDIHRHYVNLSTTSSGTFHKHTLPATTGWENHLPPTIEILWIMKIS